MKRIVFVALVALFVLAVGAPGFAFNCPSLIKQANDQIAGMDQNSDKVKKAKELVAEADRCKPVVTAIGRQRRRRWRLEVNRLPAYIPA
jgi:hypothetical protein